jgi:hypothetical protein
VSILTEFSEGYPLWGCVRMNLCNSALWNCYDKGVVYVRRADGISSR